jgi:hypothetical protein
MQKRTLNGAAILARDFERRIDFVRVDRDVARHKCDFVKSITDASFSISANPHSHNIFFFVCSLQRRVCDRRKLFLVVAHRAPTVSRLKITAVTHRRYKFF